MGTSKKIVKPKSATCCVCAGEITDADVIGLNLKLISRETTRFYCIDCLAALYEVDADYLRDKIEDWKEQGCALF